MTAHSFYKEFVPTAISLPNEIQAHWQVGVELVEGRGYEPCETRR